MLDHLSQLRFDSLIFVRDAERSAFRARVRGAMNRGELIRVWSGVYADAGEWSQLDDSQRYELTIRAVANKLRSVPRFCDLSAAAIWGLPIATWWPPTVHVLASEASGGRSHGRLRRHVMTTPPQVVHHDGLLVTSVAATIVDVARRHPFSIALAMADFALHTGLTTRDELADYQNDTPSAPGRLRSARVIEYADARADSVLESVSRAQMIDFRVPPDVLQQEIVGASGRVYFVDFWWHEIGLVGECDGRGKYERDEFTRGRSSGEVVWAEKQREDDIRAVVPAFTRWTWNEAMHPALLRDRLARAGLRFPR